MSRRMSMQVRDCADPVTSLAEYIREVGKDGAGRVGHFVMRWIPRPPDVRHEVVRHVKGGSLAEQVSIKLGCPHCHEDIEFRWETWRDDGHILRDLMNVLGEIRSLPFALLAERLLGRNDDSRRKLTDVAERLYDKLRSTW